MAQAATSPQSPISPAGNSPLAPTSIDSILAAQPARLKELNEDVAATDKKVSDINAKEGAMTMPELKLVPPPTPQKTDPLSSWSSSVMALAAIGSMFTRRPLVTAMDSVAKALNAFHQNDEEGYKTALESWKVSNENATKMADFQQKQYKDALDNYEKDKTGALAELRAKMVAFQDQTGVQQLDLHGIEGAQNHIVALKRLAVEQARAAADIDEKSAVMGNVIALKNARKELVAAQASKDPAKIQAAQAKFNGILQQVKDTNTAMGKGGAAAASGGDFTPEMGQLMAAMAEKGVSLPTGFRSKAQQIELYQGILDKNPGKTPDEIADLIKTGQIELAAQKKETQTAAVVAGKVEVAQNEIKKFAPLVQAASDKVPRGQFVPLNELVQMADSKISDPNLRVLKQRINSLLNSYDQLAARGGTDVNKRAEVRNLLLASDSPEVLKASLDSFLLEADAAHEAAVEATRVPELAQGDKGGDKGPAPAHLHGKEIWPEGDHWVYKDGSRVK